MHVGKKKKKKEVSDTSLDEELTEAAKNMGK